MVKSLRRSRGRPPIAADIERQIKEMVDKNPDVKREKLALMIASKLQASGQVPPAPTTLKERITAYRNVPYEKVDGPWTLATLPEYPVPPQALPKVLAVWFEELEKDAVHITIREAQWIARLAFVGGTNSSIYSNALVYAEAERISRLRGAPSTDLGDDLLVYEDMLGRSLSPEIRRRLLNNEVLAQARRRLNRPS